MYVFYEQVHFTPGDLLTIWICQVRTWERYKCMCRGHGISCFTYAPHYLLIGVFVMYTQGKSLSSGKGRAAGIPETSAENRNRISRGYAPQIACDQLTSTQELDHRNSLRSGEMLSGALIPMPSTPSPGFPPSLNTTFTPPILKPPTSSLRDAAQPIGELHRQPATTLGPGHRSSLSENPAERDLLSPPISANGASVELRRGDIFNEEGVEESPALHEAMHLENGQHITPNFREPVSGSRYALPGRCS